MTDPTIAEAEHALAELSADPIAREYAFRRELELADYAHRLQQQREEGKQLGLHEGKQLGLHEGRQLGLHEGKQLGLHEGKQLGLHEGKQLGLHEGKQLGLHEGKQLGLHEGKQLGLHEGKQLGLHEGRREQLLASIDALAGRCGVELGAARRGTLARLDLDPLQDVLTHLALHHSWPDEAD